MLKEQFLEKPDWMRNLPFEEVELNVRLQDVPDASECPWCKSSEIRKGYTTHSAGIEYIVETKNLVAYQCQSCEIVWLSMQSVLDFDIQARAIYERNGDKETASHFAQIIMNDLRILQELAMRPSTLG